MKFKSMLNFTLLGGAVVAATAIEEENKEINTGEGRQYSGTKKYLNYYDSNDNYEEQESNFIDGYENDEHAQETYSLPVQSHSSSTGLSENSPALSALALLGFLYFLNLIQGTSGKKKREALDEVTSTQENIDSYLKSIEHLMDTVSNYIPVDEKMREAQSRSFDSEDSFADRADRIVSFFGSVWQKTKKAFGFNQHDDVSRNDYQLESRPTPADGGFWSMFGNKVGLVATLMDFLEDPSPTRIGRSVSTAENRIDEQDSLDSTIEFAEPTELSDEEKNFLPENLSRQKRFTDGMNAWYSDTGHQSPHKTNINGAPSPIYGMLFNLLKGALTVSN